MDIKEKLNVKENVLLSKHTTFKIGGPARYFFIAENKENLKEAIKTAKELNIPSLILGLGSNVLVSDKGFEGLVIKNKADNFVINNNLLRAESGALLDKLSEETVKRGLKGLEKASGIPGTVGGAVAGNAGWPKSDWSIKDVFKEGEILIEGKAEKKDKEWFDFGYRESKLKKIKEAVILEVFLELEEGVEEELKEERREILKIRTEKIPPGFSAGSVFKNPPGKSAGFLIESAGLKGKRMGEAQISEKHANFIINLGGAKAEDVKELISLAKEKVREKFGIELEEEIRIIDG